MKKDSSFLDSVRLFLDKNGKPLVPWVNLTPAELCEAEKISHDALAELHDSPDPDAAPPRYRVSPRRWGYPIGLYLQWKQRRLSAASPNESERKQLASKRDKRIAEQQSDQPNEAA